MMRRLFVLILMLASCSGNLDVAEKPANLLTESQMEDVLRDLMILEGHINQKYETVNRYHKIMSKSGKVLLAKKNITAKQYEESFIYYNANPEKMERILDNVFDGFQKESILLQQELKDTLGVLQGLMLNDTLRLSSPSNP